MKYIDSEKLIAEIERRIDLICTTEGVVQRDKLQEYEALRDVEDFITSLQQEQPEVELTDDASFNKELHRYLSTTSEKERGGTILPIIKHFYNLRARKEE